MGRGGHLADPGIPGAVEESVAETGAEEDCGDRWEGRVRADYYVGEETGEGGYEGDAAPAGEEVEAVGDEGCEDVAEEGGEEDEGGDGGGDVVVALDLMRWSIILLRGRWAGLMGEREG